MFVFYFFMVLSLNHQINFVKDQQDGINAKLHAEYLALEEEITGLGLEVSVFLLIADSPSVSENHQFPRSDSYSVSSKSKHFKSQRRSYCLLQKYLTRTSDNLVNIEDMPKEVLDSDCAYPELKESLMQAFHSLSERYQSRLKSLQEQLQRTDR